MSCLQSIGQELLAVAFWQVDVPFVIHSANRLHVKAGSGEGIIYLLTHLETVEADSRAYLADEFSGQCAVRIHHGSHRFLGNARYGATPTSMNGTNGMVLWVME